MTGVKKVRSIRRIAAQDRWTEDSVKWVRYVPWNLYKDDDQADGEIPEEQLVEPGQAGGGDEREEGLEQAGDAGQAIVVKTRKAPPRAFQIRREDAEKHGYTRGCAGCSSWFRGMARQPHSPECRARFETLLKDQSKFQNAERKKKEYEERIREKAAKKARKEQDRDGNPGSDVQMQQDHGEKMQSDRMEPEGEGMETKKARTIWGGSSGSNDPMGMQVELAQGHRRQRDEGAGEPSAGAAAASGDEEMRPAQEEDPWEELARKIKVRKVIDTVDIDEQVALKIEEVVIERYGGQRGFQEIRAVKTTKTDFSMTAETDFPMTVAAIRRTKNRG